MKLTGNTIRELVAQAAAALPAERDLWLDLGGCIILIRCTTDALYEDLADYFKEFISSGGDPDIVIATHEAVAPTTDLVFQIKEPDPGKTKIKEEWADLPDGRVVRKRLTGMHFFFGGGVNAAVGPCLDNSNQVINFINNRFIEWKLNQGGLLGHAAGVCVPSGGGLRGISLAGFSGAGKSTLALHLMSRGTLFVSNDRVMVETGPDGLMMFGVAKQPRINPGTALHNRDLADIVAPDERERFLAMPTAELWQLEHKYDALIDECYGAGRFILKSPMAGLVILNWTRDGGPMRVARVNPAKRTDLLAAFIKSTGLFYLPENPARRDDPGMEAYVEVLSRADLIEISGGIDFDAAATVCLRYLETGEIPVG
jgi:HprK-related kinase B